MDWDVSPLATLLLPWVGEVEVGERGGGVGTDSHQRYLSGDSKSEATLITLDITPAHRTEGRDL